MESKLGRTIIPTSSSSCNTSAVTSATSINRSSYESTVNTNGILFADTFIQSGDGETQDITPSLTEAILDPDSFLRNFGITDTNCNDNNITRLDDLCKMDIDHLEGLDTFSSTNVNKSVQIKQIESSAAGITNFTVSPSATSMSNSIPNTQYSIIPSLSNTTTQPLNIVPSGYKASPNTTPTNASPVVTPKTNSPNQTGSLFTTSCQTGSASANKYTDPKFIDQYVGQRLFQEKSRANLNSSPQARPQNNTFRSFYNGLDPIPEYGITDSPKVFQPLVPPPVPPPKMATTTSYNISFPTTLQPRNDRFDLWRGQGGLTAFGNTSSAKYSSDTTGSSRGSSMGSSIAHSPGGSSVTSPFHDALATNPIDVSEFQPLNVIESLETSSRKSSSGYSSRSSSGNKLKPSKRSRTNSPNWDEQNDLSDGASSRQRRKSNSGITTSSETKRRDTIKVGLEDLQRVLPQFGTPEEEKISQATILSEAAKYLKSLKQAQNDSSTSVESLQKSIENLNQEIESLQGKLPDNGAMFSMDKNMISAKRNIPDQFADHVVDQTHQNWKYWVFTSIMGHFVHSFAEEVSATSLNDLQTTSLEWVTNAMSLQQLRKDASRKLAKLCAKTSISEDPSKLPEEALKYVSSSAHRRHMHRHGYPRTSMK